LRIAEGGRLFWSDALMSGRVARGEAWRFASLEHELRAVVDGRLQYLERYTISPERSPWHPWSAAGANYMGTTMVYSDESTAVRVAEAQERLTSIGGLRAGVDGLAPNLAAADCAGAWAGIRGSAHDAAQRLAVRTSARVEGSTCTKCPAVGLRKPTLNAEAGEGAEREPG
jgi:urease accessory protein UreH